MTTLSIDLTVAVANHESVTWHPSVGDAVQIVLPDRHFCQDVPHFACEIGRTGRIVRARPLGSAPSHPYLVLLDRPDSKRRLGRLDVAIIARHYAAEELRPIDRVIGQP